MSFGGFLLGLVMMGGGFLMAWKQRLFREYIGDLEDLFGVSANSFFRGWLSWPVVGVVLIFIGLLVFLGVWQLVLSSLLGSLVQPRL